MVIKNIPAQIITLAAARFKPFPAPGLPVNMPALAAMYAQTSFGTPTASAAINIIMPVST